MSPAVELRDLRVFLALAEELHFGRAAERLGLTHSRVSQVIGTLEQRIGGRLFDRSSRHVRLTAVGEELRRRVTPAYEQIQRACVEVREIATGASGTMRLGSYSVLAAGPRLVEIIKLFEARHPGCRVQVTETGLGADQLGWLRRGLLDVLVMRMPYTDPDVVVGPTLTSEERLLVVAADHPLARRSSVCVEDLADWTTTDVATLPREVMDAFSPPRTPSGRAIRRANLNSITEAILRVASGELVHPTVRTFTDHRRHPGIKAVPIRDLPPATTALIWLRTSDSVMVRAFAQAAADVVRNEQPVPNDAPAVR